MTKKYRTTHNRINDIKNTFLDSGKCLIILSSIPQNRI